MSFDLESLKHELSDIEQRIEASLKQQEAEARFRVIRGKAVFEEAVLAEHKRLKTGLIEYVRTARLSTLLTAPVIYGMIVPIAFLDLCVTIYQFACFPVWGMKRAKRGDFVVIDRHRLAYLNSIEKLNCIYCGYANGVIAFTREVAARTEQYWCPIKHATKPSGTHDRYSAFLDYGDAEAWRTRLDELRQRIG